MIKKIEDAVSSQSQQHVQSHQKNSLLESRLALYLSFNPESITNELLYLKALVSNDSNNETDQSIIDSMADASADVIRNLESLPKMTGLQAKFIKAVDQIRGYESKVLHGNSYTDIENDRDRLEIEVKELLYGESEAALGAKQLLFEGVYQAIYQVGLSKVVGKDHRAEFTLNGSEDKVLIHFSSSKIELTLKLEEEPAVVELPVLTMPVETIGFVVDEGLNEYAFSRLINRYCDLTQLE